VAGAYLDDTGDIYDHTKEMFSGAKEGDGLDQPGLGDRKFRADIGDLM